MHGFPLSRKVQTALLLSHFLFLTKLYSAGGIHSSSAFFFVGLKAQLGGWQLPALAPEHIRFVIFVTGFIGLAEFFRVCALGPDSKTQALLAAFMGLELYCVLLDLRLLSRTWELLVFLTWMSFTGSRTWLRVSFLAVPLSGPWPALSLLLAPLYLRKNFDRKLGLSVAAVLLFFQAHSVYDPDLLVLSLSLLWATQSAGSVSVTNWKASLAALALSAGFAWMVFDSAPDLKYVVGFRDHNGRQHVLEVLRIRGRIALRADDHTMSGDWRIDQKLYLNRYHFIAHPESLDSDLLFQAYGDELAQRHSISDYYYLRESRAGRRPTD